LANSIFGAIVRQVRFCQHPNTCLKPWNNLVLVWLKLLRSYSFLGLKMSACFRLGFYILPMADFR
jgi:hypothetical protein